MGFFINILVGLRQSMPPSLFATVCQRCPTCLGIAESGKPVAASDQEASYLFSHGIGISLLRLHTSAGKGKCKVCCLLLEAVREVLPEVPPDLFPDTYI